jgi:hypothetical protein
MDIAKCCVCCRSACNSCVSLNMIIDWPRQVRGQFFVPQAAQAAATNLKQQTQRDEVPWPFSYRRWGVDDGVAFCRPDHSTAASPQRARWRRTVRIEAVSDACSMATSSRHKARRAITAGIAWGRGRGRYRCKAPSHPPCGRWNMRRARPSGSARP